MTEIYRDSDAPYYYTGDKVLIAICVLSMAAFVVQRQYLWFLNRQKEKEWSTMSPEEQVLYQSDQEAREKDGNKRLDFRFKY